MHSAGKLIICLRPKVVIIKMWAGNIHGLYAISEVWHDETHGTYKAIYGKMCWITLWYFITDWVMMNTEKKIIFLNKIFKVYLYIFKHKHIWHVQIFFDSLQASACNAELKTKLYFKYTPLLHSNLKFMRWSFHQYWLYNY